MINYIIGILAMVGGFISLLIDNVAGACCCFGFSFILWCVMAVEECSKTRNIAYICDEKKCSNCGDSGDRVCWYTTDIRHAKNFIELPNGKWHEIYTIPPLRINKKD